MSRLNGKVAVVTGAGRGIGKAIACRFAVEGASVAVLSLTRASIDTTTAEIEAAGGTALGIGCDVRNAADIEAAIDEVVACFGRVDILVNNAMAHDFDLKPVISVTAEDIEALMTMGPIASLRGMQVVRPHMQSGGRIINFGTGLALAGMPGVLTLAMAKESIRALTRVAAREWGADGITVNTICPLANTDGFMRMGKKFAAMGAGGPPPLPPVGRMGSPDDIASVATFLASEDASYLTGYTLFADGGVAIDAAR